MLHAIRLFFAKQSLKKKLALSSSSMQAINLNAAKNILVLLDYSSTAFGVWAKFAKNEAFKQKNIQVVCYKSKLKKDELQLESTFEYTLFTNVDCAFDYSLKNSLSNTYDLVIDLNTQNEFPLIHNLADSKAKLKVGLANSLASDFYNFSIELKQPDTSEFLNQLIKYLQLLKC